MKVKVSISTTDSYCIEVVLRCLAIEGDGLGQHELNDGGILATVIAAAFKGNEPCWLVFIHIFTFTTSMCVLEGIFWKLLRVNEHHRIMHPILSERL